MNEKLHRSTRILKDGTHKSDIELLFLIVIEFFHCDYKTIEHIQSNNSTNNNILINSINRTILTKEWDYDCYCHIQNIIYKWMNIKNCHNNELLS